MTKPFAQCSLADFVHELQLAARDASGSALSADVVALITPFLLLLDDTLTQAVLEQHPGVGSSSGLVCSGAADSKQAWCSMLRDLFLLAGISVSDAARLCVYLVVEKCAKLGRVRVRQEVHAIVSGRWCLQLFAAAEQLHGARVFLRACNVQGAALVRIQLAPAAQRLRLRTLVPVYEMTMEHRQRLRGMGCGGRGKLALLMSQGGRGGGPVPRDCGALMDRIVRRVAASQVAATPEGIYAKAEALCATGEHAAAAVQLQRAIDLGHLLSCAVLAWLHIDGREGVAKDVKKAFKLAKEGARLGCHHCQGVMAYCYLIGCGCRTDEARSLELARESSGRGSRYGQYMLGKLLLYGRGGLVEDYAQALAFYRLAAAQGLDGAQNDLAGMYDNGQGVAQDYVEALRWFHLAAAQGNPRGLCNVAFCYETGRGVRKNKLAAIRWYRRAEAAGHPGAAAQVQQMFE